MLKSALQAASEEVVPFLRQIAASLDEGASIQAAYTDALGETKVLKHLVGEPVKGLPFSEAVLKGAQQSKLRPLLVFARQLQINEKAGGNLGEAIKKSAATTEMIAALQGEARAQYGSQRRRKLTLLALGVATAGIGLAARRRRR